MNNSDVAYFNFIMRIKALCIAVLFLAGCSTAQKDPIQISATDSTEGECVAQGVRDEATEDFSHLTRIDPIPETRKLIQRDKYAEANDYLLYFMDYDYVKKSDQANQLYQQIQDTRDSWTYKLRKINEGFWGGTSDELSGKSAAVVSDILIIGDLRDLFNEGTNAVQGKDVDEVTVSLSTLGLAVTATAFVTASAKPGISVLKMTNKAGKVPVWLRNNLAEISRETIKFKNLGLNTKRTNELFNNVMNLYDKAGARSTLELLGKSKSQEDFYLLARFGRKFGKKTPTLLKIAGDDAITVSQRLDEVPSSTLLEAGTFGPIGVRTLGKHGPERFQDFRNVRRRMTNLEKLVVDSGKISTVLGKRFVKRNSLFEARYVDAEGRTNIQRIRDGFAPIGKDGAPVELHHMKQQNDGLIAEMSRTEHRGENGFVLHRYLSVSEIDRNEFNKIRAAYWKERAKDFE